MTIPARVIFLLIFLTSWAHGGLFDRAEEESYADKVVVIKVGRDDLVNGQSFKFWERVLARVEEEKAKAVVFHLDTPGGLAMATKDMMSTISEVTVPTYAFVDPEALSAGALIAVATDEIYMAPGSTIGSAAVVSATGEIEKHMRAKIESAFDAHIRAILNKNGHRPEVVRAMMVIDEEEEREVAGVTVGKGDLLALNATEAAAIAEDGKPVLAAGVVNSVEELLKKAGLAEAPVVTAEPTPLERFAWLIAAWSPLLIMVGLGGGYLEMKTPGFGVGGIISLSAFSLFFFGNYVAGGLAGYELALLFVVGLVLIALELLVIPGGIVGILGGVMVVASLLLSMVDSFQWDEMSEYGGGSFVEILDGPLLSLAIGLLGAAVIAMVMMKFLPDLPLFRRLILAEHLEHETPAVEVPRESRVGETGVALTDLRPGGKARLGEDAVDVTIGSGFLPAGTRLEVVSDDRMRVVVKALAGNE